MPDIRVTTTELLADGETLEIGVGIVSLEGTVVVGGGGGGAVASVNGNVGVVVLDAADVGAAPASHTHAESDVTGLTADLAAKAPLASPALTGNPTAPTPTAGDNDISIATTAFVTAAVAAAGPGAIDDSDVAPVAPNDQTGTTYTFALADGSRVVTGNNASAQTFTIPPNSSVAFPLGTSLQVYQKGAGQVTLGAGAGVTLRTPRGTKTAVQFAFAQAIQVATDVWAVSGDVA